MFALGAQFRDDLLDAFLVDDPQTLPRNAQPHEALLVLEPETLAVQIRQEAALRFVVGVGNLVPYHRPFAGDFADPGHGGNPKRGVERAGTIPVDPSGRQGCGAQTKPRSARETWPPRLTTT